VVAVQVYIERTGVIDAEMVLSLADVDHMERYHVRNSETYTRAMLVKATEVMGRPINTSVVVLDMEGMSTKLLSSAARTYVARMARVDSTYYPETLGRMLIINAPALFTVRPSL